MAQKAISHIKLGLFVLAGLLFLILLLYMIGRNESLFGSTFPLKARFANVQGLTAGNNVRYAGIQVGTVRKVTIMNDTLIEVTMMIDTKMKNYIRKNATVNIATDGLMGNRVINITAGKGMAALVNEGDILAVKRSLLTEDMLETLARTNDDIAIVATELKNSIQRINSSNAIWKILNDNSLPSNLRASLYNTKSATAKANMMINDLQEVVADIKSGKGSLGAVFKDTTYASNLGEALLTIQQVGKNADTLAGRINTLVNTIQSDISNGNGPANAMLKDSQMVNNLQQSLVNIQEGTDRFNQVMEALKHNFLLRSYFNKQERQKAKTQRHQSVQAN